MTDSAHAFHQASSPKTSMPGASAPGTFHWLAVLRAYAGLGLKVYRHPEDMCRRLPSALALAHEMAREGNMHRSPATGYFTITEAGMALVKQLESIP